MRAASKSFSASGLFRFYRGVASLRPDRHGFTRQLVFRQPGPKYSERGAESYAEEWPDFGHYRHEHRIESLGLHQTNTCPVPPSTLAAGKSCTISITFTPAALGSRSATLTVKDSGTNSPQTVTLSGTGVAAVTTAPSSLSFGNQVIGVKSAASKITVTNNQTKSLTISKISTSPSDYSYTTTCPVTPKTLAAGSNCSVSVFFDPTVAGTRTGTLTISDNATCQSRREFDGRGNCCRQRKSNQPHIRQPSH